MWKKKCSEGYIVVTARQNCAFIDSQVTFCCGSVLSEEEMSWRRANLYISKQVFGGGGEFDPCLLETILPFNIKVLFGGN